LQALISSAELRRLAGDVSMLPAAPKVFTELVRVLGDSRSTTADAAKVVEREPALCAKILQVVNSACFGLSRKVSSIEMATRYLGTVALRNLALAMELANRDLTKSPLSGSAFKKCQHNVVLGAFLARSFVKGDRQRADDAFMAAMLRDMGCHLQASTSLPPQPCPGGVPAHTALGAYLLGLWGLPHTIIEAVAFHERPTELEHDCLEVSDIVHLADCIAGELVPSPFEATPPVLAAEHLERLGISAQSVAELRSQAQEMSQQVAGVIA
jgi:HD-like signal output (HDOD) protein